MNSRLAEKMKRIEKQNLVQAKMKRLTLNRKEDETIIDLTDNVETIPVMNLKDNEKQFFVRIDKNSFMFYYWQNGKQYAEKFIRANRHQ